MYKTTSTPSSSFHRAVARILAALVAVGASSHAIFAPTSTHAEKPRQQKNAATAQKKKEAEKKEAKPAAAPAKNDQKPAPKPTAPKNDNAANKDAKETGKSDKTDLAVGAGETDFSKQPTTIEAATMTLQSQERTFTYSGNVKVVQGDMTLTAEYLEGHYNEQNKITDLIAKKNVVIHKGPTVTAKSQRAVFDAQTNVVTLTENPEVEQDGNVLTADVVKVYLKENRSTAEGNVRMKLPGQGGSGGKVPGLFN